MDLTKNKIDPLQKKPKWYKSKMGYDFNVHSNSWQLDGSITISLNRMRELDDDTRNGFIQTLCRYAQELSGATAKIALDGLCFYCDATGFKQITVAGLTNWKASLTRENEYRLGQFKSFLIAWYEWGFSGISEDVVRYLDSLTLSGMIKGKAVKSACPYSGPLTLQEQGALQEWVSNAFAVGIITLTEYSLYLSLLFTGRRLIQIRSLRCGDLIASEDDGVRKYILKVPRVKQKGVDFRQAFKAVSIPHDLYSVLRNQCLESQTIVENQLGTKLPDGIKQDVPIFLELSRVTEIEDLQHFSQELRDRPDYLQMSARTAQDTVGNVAIANTAKSERTGDFINFTSRRFRYTKGTNLSRRGIQGVVLAEALDHSDVQNINVYVQNTHETAQHIDAVMATYLAPLSQAFAGMLIESERDALRAADPHSRVKNASANNVGNCGSYSFCPSGYRACYTCVFFQPWRDAPHHEVRDEVLAERTRQQAIGVSQYVIQSTDRLLLAVEQVISMCDKAKRDLVELPNG